MSLRLNYVLRTALCAGVAPITLLGASGMARGVNPTNSGTTPAQPAEPRVISDELSRLVSGGMPDARVRVELRLKNSPWAALMRAEQDRLEREVGPLRAQIQNIHNATRPRESLSPDQEAKWIEELANGKHAVPAMQNALREQLAEQIESATAAMRDRVRAEALPIVTREQDELSATIALLGGEVVARSVGVAGMTVNIPIGAIQALSADPRIARIFVTPEGRPALEESVPALGVPATFWAANRMGQIWDVGMIDSGCQQDHPGFSGLNFLTAPGVIATDLVDGHGTSVMGIITSRDGTHRGLAPGLDTALIGTGGNIGSHVDWMVTTAAQEPEAINVSMEFGQAVQDDDDLEQFVDAIVDDFNTALVISAGNSGAMDQTLRRPSIARNAICVANLDIQNTVDRSDDYLRNTSSRGPVPVSLRKKPDIAAPGHDTTSLRAQWATGDDFRNFTGTSAAAPHITGGYILVLQTRGDETPYANKAVLINAAEAWDDNGTDFTYTDDGPYSGSLWNKAYGWGSANFGAAYFNATDVFETTLATAAANPNPNNRLYYGTLFNGEKATLVWNRAMEYNGTMIVPGIETTSDLDLRLYRQSDGALIDSSLSSVDNVEQVGINAPTQPGDAGTPVVIRVTLDTPNRVTNAALATEENFAETTGPVLATSLVTTNCGPGQAFVLQIAVTNSGVVPAHNVITTLDTPPAGWTFTTNVVNIGTVNPGQTRYAGFLVRPPCDTDGGTGSISWVSSSSSYGRQFSDSGSDDVTITLTEALAAEVPELIFATSGSASRSFSIATNEFHVIASRPASSDWQLNMDDSPCFTAPTLASSVLPGSAIDVVVLNSNNPGVPDVGTRYVNVAVADIDAALSNTRVEFEVGFDMGLHTVNAAFTLEEVIEVFEKPLLAGVRYNVVADVVNGNSSIALSVFAPSTTYANIATGSLLTVDSAGVGSDERARFVAPESGVYGFVITKSNLGSGDLQLRITCAADHNASGSVTVQDIFDFLNDWFAQNSAADFNDSGSVSVQDIFDFLAAWFQGC